MGRTCGRRRLRGLKAYSQNLDLASLADGSYTVEMSNRSGKVSRTFTITSHAGRTIEWHGEGKLISAAAPQK